MTRTGQPTRAPRTARPTRKTRPVGPALLEPLEPRALLTNFVGVGGAFQFDPTDNTTFALAASFSGSIDAAGGASTVYRIADINGPANAQGLPNRHLSFVGRGRLLADRTDGLLGQAESALATQFLSSRGYPVGWQILDYGHDGNWGELDFFVETATGASQADVQGHWVFSHITIDNQGGAIVALDGTADISGSTISWNASSISGGASWTSTIQSVSPSGFIQTSDGRTLSLSGDGSEMLISDLIRREGLESFGLAVRETAAGTLASLAGGYRVGLARPGNATGNELPLIYDHYYLNLKADGTFAADELGAYDLGQVTPVFDGTWTVSGSTITLTDAATGELTTFTAGAGTELLLTGFHTAAGDLPATGVATRDTPQGATLENTTVVYSIPHIDIYNRSFVYELRSDGAWRVYDLSAEAGVPVFNGNPVTWTDPADGLTYAAGATSEGLILLRGAHDGTWTLRNLTTEISGAGSVATALRVMIAPSGQVNLVGLDDSGHLLRFFQTGGANAGGLAQWGFEDIYTVELAPNGETAPVFAGELVSYATSWGGLNVGGLDASGNIWSVWWAPDQTHWHSTNLSEALGAAPIVGGLTVYLTPWQGINIGGIDNQGNLIVTWWVPGFGGEWKSNNLTAETGGPTLDATSVTSYVSSWGGLNVAALDPTSGEVKVYWWSPERTGLPTEWATTSLSQTVGSPIMPPSTDLIGTAAPDGSLNVTGVNQNGDLLRYFWQPGFGGDWEVENLSATAVAI
jgi:hypothetical protein